MDYLRIRAHQYHVGLYKPLLLKGPQLHSLRLIILTINLIIWLCLNLKTSNFMYQHH